MEKENKKLLMTDFQITVRKYYMNFYVMITYTKVFNWIKVITFI